MLSLRSALLRLLSATTFLRRNGTLEGLRRLSDHELADLGYERGMLRDLRAGF